MILTPELAQQIVDVAMKLVHRNVNIMDDRGIIIASGHTHRLGTFHKGAIDALARKEPVDIYPGQLEHFPGALEGINLPVSLYGKTIGVVGIFGNPEEVRDMAMLVKTMAELILERESLCEQFRAQDHLREQFLTLLLSACRTNPDSVAAMAKLLRYRLELSRRVVMLATASILTDSLPPVNTLDNLLVSRIRQQLMHSIENSGLLSASDFMSFFEGNLIILKYFPSPLRPERQAWLEKLAGRINAQDVLPFVRIGVGGMAANADQLPQSYLEAKFALSATIQQQQIADIAAPSITTGLILHTAAETAPCLCLDEWRQIIARHSFDKYAMRDTLAALLACNMNLSQTAKKLFIHRNTLLYRLQKLKEATGLDPVRSFQHAILCKILFTLD